MSKPPALNSPQITMSETDVDEVLNIIGFGTTQVIMVIASGLVLVLAVTEIVGIAILGVATQSDFNTTDVQKALMYVAGSCGMIVSSHYMGYQMDRIGRRRLLIISVAGGTFSSLISSFMPIYWLFLICRFLVGICVAGYSSTNITYLVEFTEASKRSQVANCISYFAAIGFLYVALIAALILPIDVHLPISGNFLFKSWRILIWFYTFPGILIIIVFYVLPESAKFLLSVNQTKEAYDVLNSICLRRHGKGLEEYGVTSVKLGSPSRDPTEHIGFFKGLYVYTKPLLKPPHLYNFVTSALTTFCLFAVGNATLIWFPKLRNCDDLNRNLTFCETLEHNYKYGNTNIVVCYKRMTNFDDCVIVGVALLIGCISVSVSLNWVTRKFILFLFPILSAISVLLLNIVRQDEAKLLLFCCFVVLPSTLFNMIISEVMDMVPTDLRGKAVSLIYLAGRFGGVSSMTFIGYFIGCHCNYTLNTLGAVMIISALLTRLLP